VVIISKDLKEEIVVIQNNDAVDIDMSGWSLVSVKGDQVFTFPEGFRLGKGKTVTITSGPKDTRIRQVCSSGLPLPYGTMMEIQRNY